MSFMYYYCAGWLIFDANILHSAYMIQMYHLSIVARLIIFDANVLILTDRRRLEHLIAARFREGHDNSAIHNRKLFWLIIYRSLFAQSRGYEIVPSLPCLNCPLDLACTIKPNY